MHFRSAEVTNLNQDLTLFERVCDLLPGLSTLNQRVSTSSPQLVSRLRRFFFEQRGRVLAKLAAAPGAPTGAAEPELLDLPTEDARLAALVQPPLEGRADTALAQQPPRLPAVLTGVNRATQAALRQALDAGRAGGESPVQLAVRARSVFNDTARQAEEIAKVLNEELQTLNLEP